MRQNCMEWIKRFGQEIWVKIEDRLAWCLAVFVVAIFTMACLALKEQAFDKHAVEMYGWVWLLILSCIIFLAGYFLRDVFHRIKRIKDPGDIRNILSKWWRHCTEQCQQNEYTLYYSLIDKREKLKRGSAKKYLREIITKGGSWRIVREGSETIIVRKKD